MSTVAAFARRRRRSALAPYTPVATALQWIDAPPTLNAIGATANSRAIVVDQHGAAFSGGPAVSYASGTPANATVNSSTGLVTAVANGTSVITASATGLTSITQTATVSQTVAQITGVSSTLATDDASSGTFSPVGKDANNNTVAGATFAYSVDYASILSVNATTGAWAGQSVGTAHVTITASPGGATFVVTATVAHATVQTLDHLVLTSSSTSLYTTDPAPTLTLHAYQTADSSTPYTNTLNPAPNYTSDNAGVIAVNATTGVCTMGGGKGTATITVTAGGKSASVAITVSLPATAPASVTPSSVTARGATLTIAAPSDVATNPVTSYNIYRNGTLLANVAYSGTSQTYTDSYINSPPGTMDSAGEPYWTWSASAVRSGTESALTASASTLVGYDGWHGDDTPTSGVIWSDTFQYASVAALNTAYGTSYVDGTNAAIDSVVTYNGQPTVKMFGSTRPPITKDFHATPYSDVLIRSVSARIPGYAITGTKELYSIHYDDGGTSLEAYNAGGDGGNQVSLYLNGGQIELLLQCKTSGGTSVAGLSTVTNILGSTVTNTLRNDRRFWAPALRVTAIANGVRVRYYERVEGTTTFTGSGWQLLYDHSFTDAAVTGTVQLKTAAFTNANDNADASNAEWFARRDIVDMVTNASPYVDALPTSVTTYVDPTDPTPPQFGIITVGPSGLSSSTSSSLITPITVTNDAQFRAMIPSSSTSGYPLWDTSATGNLGTGSVNTGHNYNQDGRFFDLVQYDTVNTYVDRDSTTKNTFHITIKPHGGAPVDPKNDTTFGESNTPQLSWSRPGGRNSPNYYTRRVVKFKNGFRLDCPNNTISNNVQGPYTVQSQSGSTITFTTSPFVAGDLVTKNQFLFVTGGTGAVANFFPITSNTTNSITVGADQNNVSVSTLDSTSVCYIGGYNHSQSGAYKWGPHPQSDVTRADFEITGGQVYGSEYLTGNMGTAAVVTRDDGVRDSNYSFGQASTVMPNWNTNQDFWEVVRVGKVENGGTRFREKVWIGKLTDPTLTLVSSHYWDIDAGHSFNPFSAITALGLNFNRQLASTDALPECWMGDTQFADPTESSFAWPSQIPTGDHF